MSLASASIEDLRGLHEQLSSFSIPLKKPRSDHEISEDLIGIRDAYLELSFRSGPIKAKALRKVADQISELDFSLQLPHQRDFARATALRLIALTDLQEALQGKLPEEFEVDLLPYLFTQDFRSQKKTLRHGLKIIQKSKAHDRVFVSVAFDFSEDQVMYEIKSLQWENRHAAYAY